MNITHQILKKLAKQIGKESSPFRWIDLYAAQTIADQYPDSNESLMIQKKSQDLPIIGDLFDQVEERFRLQKDDFVILTLLCSSLTQLGKTHLNLQELPFDMMSRLRACGYHPEFQCSQELIDAFQEINIPSLINVISDSELEGDFNGLPSFLVFQQDKLYLTRYWKLHKAFDTWLNSRHLHLTQLSQNQWLELRNVLAKVFPDTQLHEGSDRSQDDINWQAVAAAHTLINPLSIITGGPGTGKTTTAASLLYLLMARHSLMHKAVESDLKTKTLIPSLKVRLLAPTGKAAVRLAEAIKQQLSAIEKRLSDECSLQIKMSDCLPDSGETVHRFLYEMGGLKDALHVSKAFDSDAVLLRRNGIDTKTRALKRGSVDIIIVDESSMMDLALMVELINVIPKGTQLILLGDHYQLPAVDPGQVFTDCVKLFSGIPHLPESLERLSMLTGYAANLLSAKKVTNAFVNKIGFQPLCELRKTYRFGGDLKLAADQIKAGEINLFKERFWCGNQQAKVRSDVVWYDLELEQGINYHGMIQAYGRYFELVSKRAELADLAAQFERYQLLCATLEGPLGVHILNKVVEQYFASSCFQQGKNAAGFYHGKAVLVTQNHPHLGIYNGDIGFMIRDSKTGNINVHFPVQHHEAIIVPPARIKAWQPAYAMSVHKSQGSEYEQVGVVLADYAKELLTRALLYTALTRAKKGCEIWAGAYAIEKAFEQSNS